MTARDDKRYADDPLPTIEERLKLAAEIEQCIEAGHHKAYGTSTAQSTLTAGNAWWRTIAAALRDTSPSHARQITEFAHETPRMNAAMVEAGRLANVAQAYGFICDAGKAIESDLAEASVELSELRQYTKEASVPSTTRRFDDIVDGAKREADRRALRAAITDEDVETALEAANGAMVDTRRHWTAEDRAAVRAMLEAVCVPSAIACIPLQLRPPPELGEIVDRMGNQKSKDWSAHDIRVLLGFAAIHAGHAMVNAGGDT